MSTTFATTFGLLRPWLALLGAVVLGFATFSAQPPPAHACGVLEPCELPGPGGTLTSVSRVPAGVRLQGNLSITTKVPATLYGYVTYGPVTTVTTSTRAFDFTIPAYAGNQVCVDIQSGGQSGNVGCPAFNVTLNPFGALEFAFPADTTSGVVIMGWAIDPDSAAPISLQVFFDGSYVTNVLADQTRTDVGTAYPGYGDAHGFNTSVHVPYTVGTHNLCVTGINVGGGANAQIACHTVVMPPPPLAPTSVNAVSTTPNNMLLQWQYPGSDRPSFKIYRAVGPNGSYQFLTDVSVSGPPPSVYNYNDNVSPDTQYCYKIQASLYGDSPQVGPVCAWTQLPAATNVHVTAATDTALTFSWTDNAIDETNYRVMLTDTKVTYSAGAHPGTGPMSYQLTGLQPNTQYCLKILTDGTNGRPSAISDQACGTTIAPAAGGGSGNGVKESLWWDCVSGHTLHLWTFDPTTGAWEDVTTLTPTFNSAAQCGPIASTGYSLSLPDGHLMTVVVVDPQSLTCGENNPQNPGCQRVIWQALGNAQGAVIPLVVY
jgi:hypothetical protein